MRIGGLVLVGALIVVAGCSTGPAADSVASQSASASVASASSSEAAATSSASASPTPKPSDPLTGFYDVGSGRKLWLECQGSGSPTIVIDVGNDDTIHGSWGAVWTPMAKISHVCAYDRANLGKSDPTTGPRTVPDVAEDLAALLAAAKVPGPYVFVGGSFGGNVVGNLAAAHPDLVAGTVFVDSEPANLDPKLDPLKSNLSKEVYAACCADYGPPAVDSPDNGEHIDYAKGAATEIANVGKQPKVPTRVLSANHYDCAADWPCDAILQSEIKLQGLWIAGNPDGKQEVVESGHVMQRDNPQAILDATQEIVERLRS
jgi:hypothetical protein